MSEHTPEAPHLADLGWDDYADLLTEVDAIAAEATEETGH